MTVTRSNVVRCSVIVPVYNDWHFIPDLLAALSKQSIGDGAFELLIVDNGSDAIPPLSLPGFARVLQCLQPGSYAARNEGVRHARGSVLAFTDADCRPCETWLEEALRSLNRRGETVILAGGVSVVPRDPDCSNWYELYDVVRGLPQADYVRRGYGITANLFVPSAVFERVGMFDGARYSGGDAEFCLRAGRSGVGIVYCDRAWVAHPARSQWVDLSGKIRRVKGGQIKHGSYLRRLQFAIRAFLPPVRGWVKITCSKKIAAGQKVQVCWIETRLWLVEMIEVIRLLLGKARVRK